MTNDTNGGFRVLWLARGDAGATCCRSCLTPLEAALAQARAKWPRLAAFYGELTVVWPWPEAPSDKFLEAAGHRVRRVEAAPFDLASRCDVAVAGSITDIGLAGLLPALLAPAPSETAPSFDAGGAHPLHEDGRRAALAMAPARVEVLLETVFAPPQGDGDMCRLLDYLGEDPSKRARRYGYALLLSASTSRRRSSAPPRADPWLGALDLAAREPPVVTATIEALRSACARADALAIAYGERWRSTIVARSLALAGANAVSGLIGALFPALAIATIPVQVVATVAILLDRSVATRGSWRAKWIEYRMLAELLRVERFLALCRASARDSDASSWIVWLVHRLAAPLPRLDEDPARKALQRLVDVEIADQIDYNQGAINRFRGLDRRIQGLATAVLVGLVSLAALIACLAFTPYAVGAGSPWPAVSLALSVAPTIHASLNAVRRDLDVARQAQSASRIAARLKTLAAATALEPPDATTARAAARRAAEVMIDAVKGWRTVHEVL